MSLDLPMPRRLRFAFEDEPEAPTNGLCIDFYPADPRVNCLFRAAMAAHVQPYMLAARVGRLSEDTATRALARAYAEGVISGSPSEELHCHSTAEWAEWLVANPREFEILREHAEPREEGLLSGLAGSSGG